MLFRKINCAPDYAIDLPVADPGSDAFVREWQDETGAFHIGIEFGDASRVALLELLPGTSEEEAAQLAYKMKDWIRRIRIIDDYGRSAGAAKTT